MGSVRVREQGGALSPPSLVGGDRVGAASSTQDAHSPVLDGELIGDSVMDSNQNDAARYQPRAPWFTFATMGGAGGTGSQSQGQAADDEVEQVSEQASDATFGDHDAENEATSASSSEYAPFSSKAMFVLAFIANNPRCPMSSQQIKSVILAFDMMGVAGVPRYGQYRKEMATARTRMNQSALKQVQGIQGHQFYVHTIAESLRSDFANPMLRKHLRLCPRRGDVIEDYMDSDAAADNPRTRPPMLRLDRDRHCYIGEVLEHVEGFAFVMSWYSDQDGTIKAEALKATSTGCDFLVSDDKVIICAADIIATGLELARRAKLRAVVHDGQHYAPLSTVRSVANKRPAYSVPLLVFLDDVSGAKSKRWNKHHVCLVQNGAFDAELLALDASLRVFTVSDVASPQEITMALTLELAHLYNDGVECWDALHEETVLVFAHLAVIVCDNPMAAELASNVGSGGNRCCRSCNFGGNKVYKSSMEGIAACTQPGEPRPSDALQESLRAQMQLAIDGSKNAWKAEATRSGVKDKLTSEACHQLQAVLVSTGQEDQTEAAARAQTRLEAMVAEGTHWNPLFALRDLSGFDITTDLPCEILHTVLLGTVKYLWRHTLAQLSVAQRSLLASWLSVSDTVDSGATSKLRGWYLIKHRQSLNGKDLKALVQVMPWALTQVGVDEDLRRAWHAQCVLAAALHVPRIDRQSSIAWMSHIHNAMQDFYSVARVCPHHFAKKSKLHVLAHVPRDLQRFGPLPIVSGERFESFNAVVRSASMLSNRHNPSRDIVQRIVDEEMLRDIIIGACMSHGDARRVGAGLNRIMRNLEATQDMAFKMYGLQKKRKSKSNKQSKGSVTVQSHCHEPIAIGDHVVLRTVHVDQGDIDTPAQTRAGRVVDIEQLAPPSTTSSTLRRHPSVALPKVRLLPLWPRRLSPGDEWQPNAVRLGEESEIFEIMLDDVLAKIHVVHDCRSQGCSINAGQVVHSGDGKQWLMNACAFRSVNSTFDAFPDRPRDAWTSTEIGRAAFAGDFGLHRADDDEGYGGQDS